MERSKSLAIPRSKSKIIPRNKSLKLTSQEVESLQDLIEIEKLIKNLKEENNGLQLRLNSQQDFETIIANQKLRHEELEKQYKKECKEHKRLEDEYKKMKEEKLFTNKILKALGL